MFDFILIIKNYIGIVSNDILSFVPLLESGDIKASVFSTRMKESAANKVANTKVDEVIQRTFINDKDSKTLILKKTKKPIDFSSERIIDGVTTA